MARLPRPPRSVALTDAGGKPTRVFQQWLQSFAEGIESELGALAAADAANAAAVAATAAAATANAAAGTAQSAATDAAAVAALTNSGVTGAVITGTDAGATVTVSVTAHTRVYGNSTSVSVNAGSVTGLPYSTLVYIYYDQASRLGGAVTYLATTSQTTAAQTGNRHLVGQITTPAALAAPATGNYVGAPGLGNIYL